MNKESGMSLTVSHKYDGMLGAKRAIANLEHAGVPRRDITVTGNVAAWRNLDAGAPSRPDSIGEMADKDAYRTGAAETAATGATSFSDIVLAAVGVILAVMALFLLVIPAVGAIVAGLIVGALIRRAERKRDVSVQSNAMLVTAEVPDADRERYQAILDSSVPMDRSRERWHVPRTGSHRYAA